MNYLIVILHRAPARILTSVIVQRVRIADALYMSSLPVMSLVRLLVTMITSSAMVDISLITRNTMRRRNTCVKIKQIQIKIETQVKWQPIIIQPILIVTARYNCSSWKIAESGDNSIHGRPPCSLICQQSVMCVSVIRLLYLNWMKHVSPEPQSKWSQHKVYGILFSSESSKWWWPIQRLPDSVSTDAKRF